MSMDAASTIDLYNFLELNHIEVWLDGGWGVDALLEIQSRPHGDVDIIVQSKDIQKLKEVLKTRGYEEIIRDDTSEWNFVLGDNQNHTVDVHVVSFDLEGKGIYGPIERGISYPANSFKGKGVISGQKVKCLTAEYQIESHTGYKIDEDDFKDVSALCKKFNIKIPQDYSGFQS